MNLLPEMRKDSLGRMYLMRLVVVAVLILFGVLLIQLVGMVPAYVHVQQQRSVYEAELAGLGEKLAGLEEKGIQERVSTLEARALGLQESAQGSTASSIFRALAAVPHAGIKIERLSFTRGKGEVAPNMTIAGVAASRSTLSAYASALTLLPYVSNVDLPISAFAKETEIPFSMTLAGSLTP